MLENRALRYTIYGTSAVLLSEAIYWLYLRVRDLCRQRAGETDVAEVIWTNELTQACSGRHEAATHSNGGEQVPGNGYVVGEKENTYVSKLPAPTATPLCRNPYCAANNVGRLIALIDKSRYTIDLAMYTFTSFDLSQAFMRAVRRGVAVRIISDKEMVYSSGSQIITLTKAGVPVRCPITTMLMHHKFCILDGSRRACAVLANVGKKYDTKNVKGIIMSGSLNWTMQGFGGNWENILITSNKALLDQFESEFERMWKTFEYKMD